MKKYATVIELNAGNIEGVYQDDFNANTPAITSHRYEKGKTYYIGARLDDRFHSDFYNELINDLSLEPVFPVKHGNGVSVQARQNHLNDYIFVMDFTEEKQPGTFESIVKDMITGEETTGDITLEKYEVRIVEKSKNK